MSTPTTTEIPDYVRSLAAAQGTNLTNLNNTPLVAVSSVRFNCIDPEATDPMRRYEALRFRASLAATEAYRAAGVPQIVMLDPNSHYQVPVAFARQGAFVVPTPRPGLATPYLDAGWLVRLHAGPNASVLKAEADKQLDPDSLELINGVLADGCDVLVGDRLPASMATMTPMQHRTEALIDTLVAQMLRVPHGTSCGVQAYSHRGLTEFLAYERLLGTLGNTWKYLLSTPALARLHGLDIGSVPILVHYDEAMVAAEDMPALTLKRLEQLLVMLEGAMEIADMVHFPNSNHLPPSATRRAEAEVALSLLRSIVVAK